MIGRGDRNDVHTLALDKLSDIREGLDTRPLVGPLLFLFAQDVFIDVAKARDAASFYFGEPAEVILAPSVETDNGHVDVVIGAADLGPGTSRPTDGCGSEGGSPEKGTAGDLFHNGRGVRDAPGCVFIYAIECPMFDAQC